MDTALPNDIIECYQRYEYDYFNSLTSTTATSTVEDSYLYGEVGFCIAGLKPAVLFDFAPAMNEDYVTKVVRPWMERFDLLAHSYQLVQRRLFSPEIPGTLIYLFIRRSDPRTEKVITNQSRLEMVSEDELANLLDYPGRLPRHTGELGTMREVAYYDTSNKLVLTTFACQLQQENQVQQHFHRYQQAMRPLGLVLGLIFRRPT